MIHKVIIHPLSKINPAMKW